MTTKFHSKCAKCGVTYHISHSVCPHCGLVEYWLDMAGFYEKKAAECRATAKRLQEEKEREAA